jgi:LPS-assembly protein
VSGVSLGLSYNDECTTLAISYTLDPNAIATGTQERNSTVMVRLDLKTLGSLELQAGSRDPNQPDGIAAR